MKYDVIVPIALQCLHWNSGGTFSDRVGRFVSGDHVGFLGPIQKSLKLRRYSVGRHSLFGLSEFIRRGIRTRNFALLLNYTTVQNICYIKRDQQYRKLE